MDYEDYYTIIKHQDEDDSKDTDARDKWYKKGDQTDAEYDHLSYSARKRKERLKRFLRASMIGASVLFFFFILLSLRIFGNDNYYTVQRGEDLYRVSRKFNVPLNVLRSLNNISSPMDVEEGMRIKIPTEHDLHIVKKGDTLYDISQRYGVKYHVLLAYNKLAGSAMLKPGTRVFIPRVLSDIRIEANTTTGLTPFMVTFDIATNTRDRIKSYTWDFGNGDFSSERRPFYTYREKGVYKAALTVVDENNSEIASNSITLNVRRLANIHFDAPQYMEIESKGDIISLNAKAIDNLGDAVEFHYKCNISGEPELLKQIGMSDKFRIVDTGYAKITIEAEGYDFTGYYFVSPIPSVQNALPNKNWYKTQFGTGLNGNCGPTSVAMAIAWARGVDIPVSKIRDYIGLPDREGGVGIYLLIRALKYYQVDTDFVPVENPEDIFKVLDRGSIVIILYNRGKISVQKEDPEKNLYGRYYTDSGGHYIVIKGYSKNKKYFVVYDPIPADWGQNNFRYADGVSMMGKNRYYAVSEVWDAMSKHVLEILKQ